MSEKNMPYEKPLPITTDGSEPFWNGCREHRLLIQECVACGHRRWPIGPACTACLSPYFVWSQLTGLGEVWSWIVYHQAFNEAFSDDLPYNVALIRLDEGHTMLSNLVGIDHDDIRLGQRVKVVFESVTPEITIPRFTVLR